MKALQAQQLPPQQEGSLFPETLQGLTRDVNPMPGFIEFSAEDCWVWFHLPLLVVEKIDYLGMRDCPNVGPGAGHQHPAVILHLKPPEAANEAATAYYRMLQAVLATQRR